MDSDHIRDIVSRWWLSFVLLPICIYILVTRGDYLPIDLISNRLTESSVRVCPR